MISVCALPYKTSYLGRLGWFSGKRHMINDGNSFLILCLNLTYQDIVFWYVSVQQQVSGVKYPFSNFKSDFLKLLFFIMERMIT